MRRPAREKTEPRTGAPILEAPQRVGASHAALALRCPRERAAVEPAHGGGGQRCWVGGRVGAETRAGCFRMLTRFEACSVSRARRALRVRRLVSTPDFGFIRVSGVADYFFCRLEPPIISGDRG